MVGYCSIGRLKAAIAPASMITIAITQAKTGRSMKKRDNAMRRSFLLRAGWGGLWLHRRGYDFHVGLDHSGALHQALHDHLVARFQAVQDLPVAADHAAGLDHFEPRHVLI